MAEQISNDKEARIQLFRNFLLNLDEQAVLSGKDVKQQFTNHFHDVGGRGGYYFLVIQIILLRVYGHVKIIIYQINIDKGINKRLMIT